MKNLFNKFSFSLIEIILVVFLTALFLGIGFFMSSGRYYISDVLRTETDNVVTFLKKAQMSAMFGVNDSEYFAVNFNRTSVRVGFPVQDELRLDGVSITDISLSNGGNEIRFLRKFGTADPNGSITLTGPGGATRIINISPSGLITQSPL